MNDVGMFHGRFVYFTAIWYSLWPFGIFVVIWHVFPVLVYRTNKNLATLDRSQNN
jgi:hypothetical protein